VTLFVMHLRLVFVVPVLSVSDWFSFARFGIAEGNFALVTLKIIGLVLGGKC
jgi:hypothetical protein